MKWFAPFVFLMISLASAGQGFRYQASIRNQGGEVIANKNVNVKAQIRSSLEGEILFSEIHEVATDRFGRLDFMIGEGGYQSSEFSRINWSNMGLYLEILLDEDKNNEYVTLGTVKLDAVPYALFSVTSANGLTDDAQTIKGKKTFLEEINGVLKGGVILNDDVPAVPGAIKWNGTDFVGFNGTEWVSLSSGGGDAVETFDCGELFIDERDGSEYRTALFGSDCWMLDNLKYETVEGSFNGSGPYSRDNAGVYYTWSGAMDIGAQYNDAFYDQGNGYFQGACPEGWHVSTHDEWLLLDELEGITGITLQEGQGSGFEARLVGDRLQDGSFSNAGISAVFWTSTEVDARNAYKRILFDGEEGVGVFVFEKDYGFCVRCVRD